MITSEFYCISFIPNKANFFKGKEKKNKGKEKWEPNV